jgi:hypothetical protein
MLPVSLLGHETLPARSGFVLLQCTCLSPDLNLDVSRIGVMTLSSSCGSPRRIVLRVPDAKKAMLAIGASPVFQVQVLAQPEYQVEGESEQLSRTRIIL